MYILCRHICVYIQMYVCVCSPQRPHRGLKPLRAVYTNTLTEDTSCCQTGREIYLPDSLDHLGIFKRKQATDSRKSGTPNCCHIAALNPQLVSLGFCKRDGIAAYALWWKQRCWRAVLVRRAWEVIDNFFY